jgi:SAM-dependent methyltransferase
VSGLSESRCPLCDSSETSSLESLDPATLVAEYRKAFDVVINLSDVDRIDYRRCSNCDLRYFHPAVAGGPEFYRQLQKIPWYYRDEKSEYEIAARYVREHDAVLEVGAGKGAFSRRIRCDSYLGLETSPDAVAMARRDGIHVIEEDLETHAARNPSHYDVVCAFQVLEHVTRPFAFMTSARDCLRDGGRLIIAVPGEDSFANVDFWDVLNMPPHHVTRWSDACLRNVARVLGMRLVAIEHEPLPDRDVRWCARLVAEYGVATRRGHRPHLLDPYMRSWIVQRGGKLASSVLRRSFNNPAVRPFGHSVAAVFEKTG